MIYEPRIPEDDPIDPTRCRAAVPYGGRDAIGFCQCTRNSGTDGWCWQHHPDMCAERKHKTEELYMLKNRRSILMELQESQCQVEALKTERDNTVGIIISLLESLSLWSGDINCSMHVRKFINNACIEAEVDIR